MVPAWPIPCSVICTTASLVRARPLLSIQVIRAEKGLLQAYDRTAAAWPRLLRRMLIFSLFRTLPIPPLSVDGMGRLVGLHGHMRRRHSGVCVCVCVRVRIVLVSAIDGGSGKVKGALCSSSHLDIPFSFAVPRFVLGYSFTVTITHLHSLTTGTACDRRATARARLEWTRTAGRRTRSSSKTATSRTAQV